MPTYEYFCSACSKSFAKFQSISSEPVSNCPKCSRQSKRTISAGSGIVFKGSGFYVTDYKRKPSEKPGAKKQASKAADNKPSANTSNKDSTATSGASHGK